MAFITDKEELKPGLIIFRRTDVDHRNFYCRVKLPKEDRYKTISLKTADITAAREKAFDHDADVRFRLKHDVPVFNRPFSDVAEEYVALQERRAATGEITRRRVGTVKSVIKAQLNPYVGSTQIHLIGHERWENYPTWRRGISEGRIARRGQTRPLTEDEKTAAKAKASSLQDPSKKEKTDWVFVSDSTISSEMSVFSGIMNFAAGKKYIPVANRFGGRPKLKTERREEFSLEEYRKLHTVGRQWMKASDRKSSRWSREVTYNFMLIMCNTGMRPPEAANLRWRDITHAEDKDGRKVVVIYVHGKGKERKLVAPASVGDYLERIRKMSCATKPDDRVFSIQNGKPAKTLYSSLIEDLFDAAGLHEGPGGTPRSTYSFRHTYATLRLSQGIDVYLLAEQMGTSVQMIQDHYGHVNAIKHADLALHGIGGWEPPVAEADKTPATSKAAARSAAKAKDSKAPRKPH
jgi:integrase